MARGVSVITAGGQDYNVNDPNIAAEFSSSASYAVNDYVNYNGNLYRFTADHSGAWSSGDVEQVKAGTEIAGMKKGMGYSEKTNNLIAPKGLILGKALNPNTLLMDEKNCVITLLQTHQSRDKYRYHIHTK